MLIGQYAHTLDIKNRLSLPSKFKKVLGEKVVVSRGLDSCLYLFTISEWESIASKLSGQSVGNADSRDINRFFLSGAVEIDIDSAGRILLPDFLRDFAKLQNKLDSKVILAGLYSKVEIWDEKIWEEKQKNISQNADKVAAKLQELGMI